MNLGYHFDLIREAMLAMAEENGSAQFSSDAVDLALLGNSYNDIFQVNETRMLVQQCLFPPGQDRGGEHALRPPAIQMAQ